MKQRRCRQPRRSSWPAPTRSAACSRAVVNRRVVRGPLLQRLDDDEVAEIRSNKKTTKEFEDARDRFNAQFASGKSLAKLPGAETWSYLVEQASSLANLKKRVEDEITKGQNYFASLSTPKITLPVDHLENYPRRRYHWLEIHYHPVAASKNYLHIKMKAGGTAQNKVEPGNRMIDKARLNAGVKAWTTTAARSPRTRSDATAYAIGPNRERLPPADPMSWRRCPSMAPPPRTACPTPWGDDRRAGGLIGRHAGIQAASLHAAAKRRLPYWPKG